MNKPKMCWVKGVLHAQLGQDDESFYHWQEVVACHRLIVRAPFAMSDGYPAMVALLKMGYELIKYDESLLVRPNWRDGT